MAGTPQIPEHWSAAAAAISQMAEQSHKALASLSQMALRNIPEPGELSRYVKASWEASQAVRYIQDQVQIPDIDSLIPDISSLILDKFSLSVLTGAWAIVVQSPLTEYLAQMDSQLLWQYSDIPDSAKTEQDKCIERTLDVSQKLNEASLALKKVVVGDEPLTNLIAAENLIETTLFEIRRTIREHKDEV